MKPKCFFCDKELEEVLHTFRVGPKDEPVCEECHRKTENRRDAKAQEEKESSG
jgi:hypothetical protein